MYRRDTETQRRAERDARDKDSTAERTEPTEGEREKRMNAETPRGRSDAERGRAAPQPPPRIGGLGADLSPKESG